VTKEGEDRIKNEMKFLYKMENFKAPPTEAP